MTESCHFNDKNSLGGSFCVWRGGSIMATTRIIANQSQISQEV